MKTGAGRTEVWPISKLKTWAKNPRDIDAKGLNRLKAHIRRFGMYKPLIVNISPKAAPVGAVAGGNMRLRALKELHFEKVWVIPKKFKNEQEMIEISLSDNDRFGSYVEADLAGLVSGLDMDQGLFSVDLKEPPTLDDIVSNYSKAGQKDDEAPPLPKKAKSKLGDLYALGNHRLLCGDATKEEDYIRLLGTKCANLVFTDPPYNVDYTSPGGMDYKSKKFDGTKGKMLNDNLSDEKHNKFLSDVADNIYKFTTPTMSFYWWFASRNFTANQKALTSNQFFISQWIIWVKNSMVLSRQDYHRCFEPCLVGWKKGKKHFSNKNIMNFRDIYSDAKSNDETLKKWLSEVFVEEFDVWFQHRDATTKYLHPTQKPVALAERAIKKNSKKGDIVLDVFGGSGSTLIAAEKLSRRAYLMELDPRYVDVIIKRWEGFTGKKAKKAK